MKPSEFFEILGTITLLLVFWACIKFGFPALKNAVMAIDAIVADYVKSSVQ